MKSPLRQRRTRTLKAKAAVMDSAAEFDDYGPEPNMKLSHAFMVVLALHVVAVGGLFAFNKVKAGHSKASEKVRSELAAAQEAVVTEDAKPSPVTALHELEKNVAKIAGSHQQAQAPAPLNAAAPVVQPVVNQASPGVTENPPPSSSSPAVAAPTPEAVSEAAPAVAMKEYTIVKGDNPYKVAKKFHVSYDSLMKLNNITDPRKIQIGQKLKIPAAAPHGVIKHSS